MVCMRVPVVSGAFAVLLLPLLGVEAAPSEPASVESTPALGNSWIVLGDVDAATETLESCSITPVAAVSPVIKSFDEGAVKRALKVATTPTEVPELNDIETLEDIWGLGDVALEWLTDASASEPETVWGQLSMAVKKRYEGDDVNDRAALNRGFEIGRKLVMATFAIYTRCIYHNYVVMDGTLGDPESALLKRNLRELTTLLNNIRMFLFTVPERLKNNAHGVLQPLAWGLLWPLLEVQGSEASFNPPEDDFTSGLLAENQRITQTLLAICFGGLSFEDKRQLLVLISRPLLALATARTKIGEIVGLKGPKEALMPLLDFLNNRASFENNPHRELAVFKWLAHVTDHFPRFSPFYAQSWLYFPNLIMEHLSLYLSKVVEPALWDKPRVSGVKPDFRGSFDRVCDHIWPGDWSEPKHPEEQALKEGKKMEILWHVEFLTGERFREIFWRQMHQLEYLGKMFEMLWELRHDCLKVHPNKCISAKFFVSHALLHLGKVIEGTKASNWWAKEYLSDAITLYQEAFKKLAHLHKRYGYLTDIKDPKMIPLSAYVDFSTKEDESHHRL